MLTALQVLFLMRRILLFLVRKNSCMFVYFYVYELIVLVTIWTYSELQRNSHCNQGGMMIYLCKDDVILKVWSFTLDDK